MKTRKKFFACAFGLAVLWGICAKTPLFAAGSKEQGQTEIIVSAAASLADAMNEAIAVYQKTAPTIRVTPTYGSSGSLQRQIEQGAPADIFISAAGRQMDELETAGLVTPNSRRDLLKNEVVLIVPKGKTGVNSFNDAATDAIRQIALGEPGSVPVGQYAEQVFTSLGILDKVKQKAVYAKDVRQALVYVEQGEVDAAVVYSTDAAISSAVSIAARAGEGSHAPVVYPAALITNGEQPAAAGNFLAWLSSEQAGAIFVKYGFGLVDNNR
jgi:molybdate transport system substrate-binding protein